MSSIQKHKEKVEGYKRSLLKLSRSRAKAFRPIHESVSSSVQYELLHKAQESLDDLGKILPEINSSSDALDLSLFRSGFYDYLHAACKHLLEPISRSLQTLSKSRGVESYWDHQHHYFQDRLANLPVKYVRPLPSDIYSRYKNHGNAISRGLAEVIKFSKSTFGVGQDQHIPFKGLAVEHFGSRLTKAEANKVKSAYRDFAGIFRPLETACESWFRAAIELDIAIDEIETAAFSEQGPVHSDLFASHEKLVKNIDRLQLSLLTAIKSFGDWKDEPLDYDILFTSLEEDIELSDTVLASKRNEDVPLSKVVQTHSNEIGEWQSWLNESANFFMLCATLIDLRRETSVSLSSYSKLVLEKSRDDIIEKIESLLEENRDFEDRSKTFFESPKKRKSWKSLHRFFDGLRIDIDKDLTIEADSNEEAIDANSQIDSWSARIQNLNRSTQLHRSPQSLSIQPGSSRFEAKPRTWVEQSFDSILLDRFRSAPESVIRSGQDIRAAIETSKEIIRVGLEAAISHSESLDDNGKRKYSLEEAYKSCDETIVTALTSANELLEERKLSAENVGGELYSVLVELKATGWRRLLTKLASERRLDSSVSSVKDLASLDMERLKDQTLSRAKSVRLTILVILRQAYRKLRSLLRFGKGALGIEQVESDEVLYSPDFYSSTDRVVSRLPLVYQHLFSLRPVHDPAILDGRKSDLVRIKKHFDIWKKGVCNGLLIVGSHGAGMSSLLNVAGNELFAECRINRIAIKQRIRDEKEFCSLISKELGLGRSTSLDQLRDSLRKHKALASKDEQQICMIENIEHLLLRTTSGMKLIEDVLVFISQTDDVILWIATMGKQSWQLVDKLSTKVGNLLVVHQLSKITKENLESVILNRQMRSGLPLEFVMPKQLNPLIRRRFIGANTADEKQEVLKEHFFEGLYKEAGENLTLALIYWLNSIVLDQSNGRIQVKDLKRLNFSFLESFDADRAFSLKAFLEHGSLNIPEHAEIFNTKESDAQVILESFANLNLIEPFDVREGHMDLSVGSAEREMRYRIRPLLVQPVVKYLADRNIIH